MIVLASASPRRPEQLAQAGFAFEVEPSLVAEVRGQDESPVSFVTRLAREKAQEVEDRRRAAGKASRPVLGADTAVVIDDQVLGKPENAADAKRMLRLLAGRTHAVYTGVCLIGGSKAQTAVEVTYVSMLTLDEREIEAYVSSGEPMDKAGSYGIQGRAARWIPRIQGCYFNVVGLPVSLVSSMVEAHIQMEARSAYHAKAPELAPSELA